MYYLNIACFMEVVHIQLSNETRKVVMLKVFWKNLVTEFVHLLHHEPISFIIPANDIIWVWITYNFISLYEEGRHVCMRVCSSRRFWHSNSFTPKILLAIWIHRVIRVLTFGLLIILVLLTIFTINLFVFQFNLTSISSLLSNRILLFFHHLILPFVTIQILLIYLFTLIHLSLWSITQLPMLNFIFLGLYLFVQVINSFND